MVVTHLHFWEVPAQQAETASEPLPAASKEAVQVVLVCISALFVIFPPSLFALVGCADMRSWLTVSAVLHWLHWLHWRLIVCLNRIYSPLRTKANTGAAVILGHAAPANAVFVTEPLCFDWHIAAPEPSLLLWLFTDCWRTQAAAEAPDLLLTGVSEE